MGPEEIAERLGLEPLDHEGGRFRRTHHDGHSSAIYYLLTAGEASAPHRLAGTEVYHWYAGAPLGLLVIRPDGRVEEPVLGPDLAAGQRPQVVVPAGSWHGSAPLGEWSLVGTTMSPPFAWDGFELGDVEALAREHPAAAGRLRQLGGGFSPGRGPASGPSAPPGRGSRPRRA